MSEWRASPQLVVILTQALETFERHWPTRMRLVKDSSEAGRAFTADYGKALFGVDMDAIPQAVDAWMREDNEYPPKPGEFGKLAREISRRNRPPLLLKVADTPNVSTTKNFGKIDTLGQRAYAELGNWTLVAEAWCLLFHVNPHTDHQQASRDGNVPFDVWDAIVQSVQRGERAPEPSHPKWLGKENAANWRSIR